MYKKIVCREFVSQSSISSDHKSRIDQIIEAVLAIKPEAERNLDQVYATSDTLLDRLAVYHQIPVAEDASWLFLGHEISALLLAAIKPEYKITLLEIDDRLVDAYKKIVDDFELNNVQIVQHDLRDSLPNTIGDSFDVVFLDPPYTPDSAELWAQRAVESLVGRGSDFSRKQSDFLSGRYIVMCYGYTDKSTERGLRVQSILSDLGLVIQEKIRAFNRYDGAKGVDSSSDLYILQATPKIKLSDRNWSQAKLYTGQKQK